jgi:flagellar operon protein
MIKLSQEIVFKQFRSNGGDKLEQRIYQSLYRAPLPNITTKNKNKNPQIVGSKQVFSNQLQTAVQKYSHLKISKHAEKRLEEREILINAKQWKKIEDKVSQAKLMGVQESLVVTNDAALIISVKNNTVITAMDRVEAESQIFTNINGTILIDV